MIQFPNIPPPADSTVKKIYEKFVTTGTVLDLYKDHAGRPKTAETEENIKAVDKFFKTSKQPSMRKCAAAPKISTASVWRILHKDLDFKAYKVSTCQLLKASDINARMTFEAEMREKIERGIIDVNKI